MAYATLDDLLKFASTERLVELTDRAETPTGAIDQTIIDQALEDATAVVDSYLAAADYVLPLVQVPRALRGATAIIAYYRLHVEHVPDKVAEDHKAQLRWLEMVAKGTVKLTLPSSGADAPTTGGTVRSSGPARVFTRTSLDGW